MKSFSLNLKEIIGSWSLKDFTVDGKSWGENLKGLLIYGADGYMSVGINRNSQQASFDVQRDCLFYSGRFVLQDNLIEHDVNVATDAEKIDHKLMREVSFENNVLSLSGSSKSGKKFLLRWCRL